MKRNTRRKLELRYLKRLPTVGVIAAVVAITALSVWLWLWFASKLINQSALSEGQWSVLSSLTSVVALGLAIGAGIMVLIELGETADSRNMEVYRDIYEKLMSEEQIRARRFLYQNLPSQADSQTKIEYIINNEEAKKNVKLVLNLIDYFGFLVEQDWVTSDEVVGWVSPVIVKVWTQIEPVVDYECRRRPEEPDYYEHARILAEKCKYWRDANFPDRDKTITFDDKRL